MSPSAVRQPVVFVLPHNLAVNCCALGRNGFWVRVTLVSEWGLTVATRLGRFCRDADTAHVGDDHTRDPRRNEWNPTD